MATLDPSTAATNVQAALTAVNAAFTALDAASATLASARIALRNSMFVAGIQEGSPNDPTPMAVRSIPAGVALYVRSV